MEQLIETVNQLQDVFYASGCECVDLPQIVVVGTQSSGKSSVLEHLVGKSFLPRGTGIVTRCPLILQLLHTQSKVTEEYAIFQHNKTKVFTDYNLIRKEIQEQTVRMAGDNKGICQVPINLKLFSTAFVNLTLVDLPGLTKVPVGDQPQDIEQQCKELTMKYIENPNCVILAVTPANADMATSESLKIAKEVDPNGVRTLAVVTKLDLMDDGTDAWEMLSGKIIPVKLGIIGVVNRSQKDIMDDKTIIQSLKDEATFFQKRYKRIAVHHGSPYLAKKVQEILISHIKNCMPKLKERISKKLAKQRAELKKLGEDYLDKSTLLLKLITKFSNSFIAAIKGNSEDVQIVELQGGARINYVFQECFATALKSIDCLAGLSKGAILTAMQNASGVSPTLFVSETAFELLVKKQIEMFRSPSIQCADLIHEEMIRVVQVCVDDQELNLNRYPKLQKEISLVIKEILQNRLPITCEMLHNMIDVELAYINTAHPDFLSNCRDEVSQALGGGDKNLHPHSQNVSIESLPAFFYKLPDVLCPSLDKTTRDCLLIQELIRSYLLIVKKNIQDVVPKTIMHYLVNYVTNRVQFELVAKLYKSDSNVLLQESVAVIERRKHLQEMIKALEEANSIIKSLKPTISLSINKVSRPEQPEVDLKTIGNVTCL